MLFWGTWKSIGHEAPPPILMTIAWLALLIRLGAGCLWYLTLPKWGHDTAAEKAGYIMADAGARDQAAWKLSQSEKPLWSVFQDHRKVDQYGGLLFLSAAVYRYTGTEHHPPLLIIVITATLGAIAVLFTWTFARRIWGEKSALLAAWGLCLYPEAVLIGSSQMREAFMMPLVAASFLGLSRYEGKKTWINLIWAFLPLVILLPLSPPLAASLFATLTIYAGILWAKELKKRKQTLFWLSVVVLFTIILAGLWLSLRQFTPEKITNPMAMLAYWLRKSAQFQAHLSEQASGWMQKVFDSTPSWTHLPLLVLYGILQPFLPAALIVGSQAPIWRWISLWRSVGWTLLLPLIVFAPILAWRRKDRLAAALSLVVWLVVVVASLRGGADMWDNPRYRAAFAALQVALAAWVVATQIQKPDPWLRRVLLSFGVVLLWFIPWYLRRYTSFPWEMYPLAEVLAAGGISAGLLVIMDLTKPVLSQQNHSDFKEDD